MFPSKLSFKTLYDCDLNEAIDDYAGECYCRHKSFNSFNTLIRHFLNREIANVK